MVARALAVALSLALLGTSLAAGTGPAGEPDPGGRAGAAAPPVGRHPLGFTGSFEENLGQTDPSVAFVWRGRDHVAYITADGAVVTGGGSPIRLRFIGARPERPRGIDVLSGRSSYFIGDDPREWVSGARHFARVLVPSVYPGIDVVWRADRVGLLEYDLVVAPGADPGLVRIGFTGATPATAPGGDLRLRGHTGQLLHRRPVAFQSAEGVRRVVPASYRVDGKGEVRLSVGAYDRSRRLVVDPVLEYSTFLGGGLSDWGMAIDATEEGEAVVAGYTQSTDFPGGGAGFGEQYVTDVFVTKLAPDGSMVYSVFLGGDTPPEIPDPLELGCANPLFFTALLPGCGSDYGLAVALDQEGSAYIAGFTDSDWFPTVNAAQPSNAGGTDGFVSKISPSGQALVYSTYVGGTGAEELHGIAVDDAGRAVATGATNSTDFPTAGAIDGSLAGATDAVVLRLAPSGSRLEWSTYLGGGGPDLVDDVAVGADGSSYLTGWTGSTDFPTRDPIQPDFAGGEDGGFGSLCPCDAFLTKISPGGDALVWSTYLGGASNDKGRDLVVDEHARVYAIGWTWSTDFPTADPIQATKGGDIDGYIAYVRPDGRELEFSTYLGGEFGEEAAGIARDRCGNVYAAGYTPSPDFPTHRSMQGPNPGSNKVQNDGYLLKLDEDRSVVYATLWGGRTYDGAYGVAVDRDGTAYLAGFTGSDNFPTEDPAQPAFGGETDATAGRVVDEVCDPHEAPG